jgi:hypothetical protein
MHVVVTCGEDDRWWWIPRKKCGAWPRDSTSICRGWSNMPATNPASPLIIIAAPVGAPDGLLELVAGVPPALPAPILLVRYPAPRRLDD